MRYKNETKKKSTGAVYTPVEMADYVSRQMLKYSHELHGDTVYVLDPAVGAGELLISMIQALLPLEKQLYVVGYETDEEVGKATESNLKEMFPTISVDIRIGNFLSAVEGKQVEKFDYVIANPPYIRTQIMGSEEAQKIADKLSLAGRIDIYYAFLVFTHNVLKEHGIAGYITSNKFMTIKAGNSVRNYMFENYDMHHIIDLGDTKLFDASVLPCIMVFSLGRTKDKQNVHFTSVYQCQDVLKRQNVVNINSIFDVIDKDGFYSIPDGRIYQFKQGTIQSIAKNSLWTLSSDDNAEWLSKVDSNTWMTFSQIGKIRVGIKTTADNVFIGDDWTGEKANLELLRPLITHRNSGQIVANNTSHWQVLYTHTTENGKKVAYDIDGFPKTKAYLMKHYEQLSGRQYVLKANRNWYEIWVPQNPESWGHKKIVFRDISAKPEFWYDETGAIVNGDCYWIDINPGTLEEIVYLALAIANSKFIEKYYDVKFNTKLYSGKRRYQTQYVEQFPLPYYGTKEAQQAITIVKEIIAEDNSKTVSSQKKKLDDLVEKMFS
ncbi:MAG: N-6 DNA methylase [Schwartzia sp.]|nr:N-6 DNA methylase [Schwartzia sp. (in: firmicutes)]